MAWVNSHPSGQMVILPHFKWNTCHSFPSLVARLQDGLSPALPWRCVQSDAALLAVQPWGPTKVLRTAAGPRCRQKEVMSSLFVPFKRMWCHQTPCCPQEQEVVTSHTFSSRVLMSSEPETTRVSCREESWSWVCVDAGVASRGSCRNTFFYTNLGY